MYQGSGGAIAGWDTQHALSSSPDRPSPCPLHHRHSNSSCAAGNAEVNVKNPESHMNKRQPATRNLVLLLQHWGGWGSCRLAPRGNLLRHSERQAQHGQALPCGHRASRAGLRCKLTIPAPPRTRAFPWMGRLPAPGHLASPSCPTLPDPAVSAPGMGRGGHH